MKRALVLGGGGARGSFQVGMLLELIGQQELDFQIIRGVSVGALNAAFLAQAPVGATPKKSLANLKKQVDKLHNLWTNEIKGNFSVYAERAGGFAGLALGADSIYSVKPLRELIKKHLSLQKLRSSGRDFAVGTVSLLSGGYEEWTPASADFIEKLVASTAIPVIFPFVRTKTDVMVDGGARNMTPLSAAFRARPDEIYVLMTSRLIPTSAGKLPDSAVQQQTYQKWDDSWLGTKVSGIDVLKRTLDILVDEIYLDDLRGALDWNQIAGRIDALTTAAKGVKLPAEVKKQVTALGKTVSAVNKRHVPIHVLAPRIWFGTDNNSTVFDPALIANAIEHGHDIGKDPNLWVVP
ncbi:MAG: patatin-like phospholipase family protein [Acidobacteria bacterium]|nr:patatin-like phospholipase family protein [Acidobacteriota bacterium]